MMMYDTVQTMCQLKFIFNYHRARWLLWLASSSRVDTAVELLSVHPVNAIVVSHVITNRLFGLRYSI